MKNDFFKFPSTPHLAVLSNVNIRNDKVLTESERNEFLRHNLVIEEKVDGANLGFSFDSEGKIRAQNRGAYLHLPGSGQWKKLDEWLSSRIDLFFGYLSDRLILFGEWCYAQHSIYYDSLPDWFLGFDLYDRQAGRFYSTQRRDELFTRMGVSKVPEIARGRFSFPEIKKLSAGSKFSEHAAEGIYLRFDKDDWLMQRAKLVRPAFIQSIERHWSHFAIKTNRLY